MEKNSPNSKKKIETMRELCLSRKSQNFNSLKEWDRNRAALLTVHRRIIDEIDENLQLKQSESNDFLKTVKHFFTDILSQRIKYLSGAVQNPQKKLMTNSVGKNIYRNVTGFMGRLCKNTESTKQYRQIKNLLEQELDSLDAFFFETEKQLMDIRTQIEISVLEVQNCNMETVQKCDSLVGVYNSAKNLKAFQATTDFYIQQQQFLEAASNQLRTERELGAKMTQYLQLVEERQKNRLQTLKALISKYIDCITANTADFKSTNSGKIDGLGGNSAQSAQLVSLRQILDKNTQNSYLEEYFSIEELISKGLISELSTLQGLHEKQLTNKYLKNFLKKFNYEEFSDRNLILKSMGIFIKPLKEGEELMPVELLISVDGFINVFQNEYQNNEANHEVKKVMYCIKISMSLDLVRVGDIEVQINVKKWGLMTFGENEEYSLSIVFSNQDQRQEFIEFVQQLR